MTYSFRLAAPEDRIPHTGTGFIFHLIFLKKKEREKKNRKKAKKNENIYKIKKKGESPIKDKNQSNFFSFNSPILGQNL